MADPVPRVHRQNQRRPSLVVLVVMVLAVGPAWSCDAPILAQYRSQSPLLAETPDSALQVSVHEGGCVRAHFPRQDLRAGTRTWRLPAAEWQALQAALRSEAVSSIAVAELDRRLHVARQTRAKALAGPARTTLYASVDENLIELVLPASAQDKRAGGLSRSSLHADQRTLPGDPDLARIAALVARFESLASAAHQHGAAR